MNLRLQVTLDAGSTFAFAHAGPHVRVGRNPDGELVLRGPALDTVSFNHLRIELTPERASVHDLGSTNGTYINDRPVTGQAALHLGDTVRLGQTGPALRVLELDLTPSVESDRETRSERDQEQAASSGPAWLNPRLVGGAALGLAAVVLTVVLWAKLGRPRERAGQPGPEPVAGPTANHRTVETPPLLPPLEPIAPAPELPSSQLQDIGQYVSPVKGPPPSVLLQRQRTADPWGRLETGQKIQTDHYLVSLPGYRSKIILDRGVTLTLWGNVPVFAPFPPLLESTVMLHAPGPGVDLELTLDHGRILLANAKASGPARVRVRFQRAIWDLTLTDSSSQVVLELWGLDDPAAFLAAAPTGKGPLLRLDLWAKGSGSLEMQGKGYPFSGTTHALWSSDRPSALAIGTAEKLPPWWTDKLLPRADAVQDMMLALTDWSDLLSARKGQEVLDVVRTQVDEAEYPAMRQAGVLALGALEALPRLVDALEGRHADVRSAARYALQRWITRGLDQETELLQELQRKGYPTAKAHLLLGMLHTCPDEATARPETYARLIALLGHENLTVRELAWEQLAALVPAIAIELPFEPTADEDKRQQVIAQWRKRIPEGTVPPRKESRS